MIRTLPLLVLLAACGDAGLTPPAGATGDDSCGAAQFEGLVGQPLGDGGPLLDSGVTYRVVYPDSVVTLDYDADRVNVNLSDDGIILSVGCG